MNDTPWPSSFSLDPRKIVHYLLDESHREGGAKARFFKRFGFDPVSPFVLSAVLLAHPRTDTFTMRTRSARGDIKFVFEGPIAAPDGRAPRIRTVWRLDDGGRAHFVTAVPLAR